MNLRVSDFSFRSKAVLLGTLLEYFLPEKKGHVKGFCSTTRTMLLVQQGSSPFPAYDSNYSIKNLNEHKEIQKGNPNTV